MMSPVVEQQDIGLDLDENAQVDDWNEDEVLAQVKKWVSLPPYPAVSGTTTTTLE